jgi:hypothetical protein
MQENQTLRNLLRSLATFIGEGAGGLLPKLGWEMSDFNNFINRSETDTAWEGYQKRKKSGADVGGSGSSLGQKRPSEDDSIAGRAKKSRPGEAENGYSMLLPMHGGPLGTNSMYSSSRPSGESNGIFSDIIKNSNGSGMFASPPTASSQYASGSPTVNNYQSSSYIPTGVNMLDSSLPPLSFPPSSSSTTQQRPSASAAAAASDDIEDDDDPNKNEAYKLIQYVASYPTVIVLFTPCSYHLDNFKRNSAYCLPSSLRPTLVQRHAFSQLKLSLF